MTNDSTIIRCPSCGASNRVPRHKVESGLAPICGRCATPLPLSSDVSDDGHPITVTDGNFTDHVERSRLPVLVDLWAPWCPPCRMIAPMIDELAAELVGKARVAKVNIDESPGIARRFHVNSIPTLLVFKDGKEVDRIVGAQPKSQVLRRLEGLIA